MRYTMLSSGALKIHVRSPGLPLALKNALDVGLWRCRSAQTSTVLPSPSPLIFICPNSINTGLSRESGVAVLVSGPHPPHPTPSPSFCTGCCVVLPAQVSPNPFPRPCCAINPHPQTIGQSWHYHDLMETRMSRVSKEGTPSKLELLNRDREEERRAGNSSFFFE